MCRTVVVLNARLVLYRCGQGMQNKWVRCLFEQEFSVLASKGLDSCDSVVGAGDRL